MSGDSEISQLDDPALLTECSRVREELRTLTERYQELSNEFSKRAEARWTD